MPIVKRAVYLLLAIVFCVFCYALSTLIFNFFDNSEKPLEAVQSKSTDAEEFNLGDESKQDENFIVVFVTGAVKSVKVVQLPMGSRVLDAIEKAGGALPVADLEAINLARVLQDGEQIRVPVAKNKPLEANYFAQEKSRSNLQNSSSEKININTADASLLEKLPYVGKVMAQRIIDYRQKMGPFKSIEEIQRVQGIGKARFERLKEKITVE